MDDPTMAKAYELLQAHLMAHPKEFEGARGPAGWLFANALLTYEGHELPPIATPDAIIASLQRIESNQEQTVNIILNAITKMMDMGSFYNKDGRSFKEEFDEHTEELIENVTNNLTGRTFDIED